MLQLRRRESLLLMLGAARSVLFGAVVPPPTGDGAVKDGTPSDDAVPAGFVNPIVNNGATGDGVANDTAELDAALGGSAPVWLGGPGEVYRITNSVALARETTVISWGAVIRYDRSANDSHALLAPAGGTAIGWRMEGLRIVNENQSSWSGDDNVGFLARSVKVGRIEITEVKGFSVGFRSAATDSNSFSYTWIGIGEIVNCQWGHHLTFLTNTSGTWQNSNWYFGGLFKVESGVNDTQERRGLYWETGVKSDYGFNHNLTFGQSFELNAAGASGAVRNIYMQGAQNGVLFAGDDSGGSFPGDSIMTFDSGGTGDTGSMHEIKYGRTTAAVSGVMFEKLNPPHRAGGEALMVNDRRRMTLGAGAPENLTRIGYTIA